jgi:predicted RNA-binding protein YlxR (DUF448 family)/ribosomal protein L30E
MDEAASAADPADADEAAETGPLRRCIVTGERCAKDGMLRLVVAPDGVIVPDVAAALPGRGLWLIARRDIVAAGTKKRQFDRAARRSVTVPPDLADRIEALLAARCRDAIGLARRGGKAVAGFEKAAQMLRGGQAGLIVAAADGAEDGRRKIAALAPDLPVLAVLNAAELGRAFGRDHVVHAVIGAGPLADRLLLDGARLAGFRADGADLAGANQRRA